MKTYDIFPFNDELELLNVRFNVLNPVVDYFVVVEAPNNFYGQPKPFIFEENRHLFNDFNDKVIHVKLPPFNFGMSFNNDAFQKNYGFYHMLGKTNDEDLFISSDLDEIPNPDYVREFKLNPERPWCVKNQFNHYALDIRITNVEWYGSMLFRKPFMSQFYVDEMLKYLPSYKHFTFGIRDKRADTSIFDIKENGGWHYTYLANKELGIQNILRKIKTHTHSELHYMDLAHVQNAIKNLKPLHEATQQWTLEKFELNKSNTPEYILNNLDKYQHLLYNNLWTT